MSGSTIKLLRKYARITKHKINKVKNAYQNLNWIQKTKLLKDIKMLKENKEVQNGGN